MVSSVVALLTRYAWPVTDLFYVVSLYIGHFLLCKVAYRE